MPCYIQILSREGLRSVDYSANSIAEAAQYETNDGVYTVTNTYNTYQTLKFGAHLDRLEQSANKAGIPLTIDRKRLYAALREMITTANYGSVRFRITIPRATPDELIISMEPFTPLSEEFIWKGVHCASLPNGARSNPEIKSTGWMHRRGDIQRQMEQGIYETLLLSGDGYILEGLGSNFYAIVDGELYTAGEGVLGGISRQIVLEIAPDILPINQQPIHISKLADVQETFMTSSSRGIVPIVKIDDTIIADGTAGKLTRQLRAAYQKWVESHLETL